MENVWNLSLDFKYIPNSKAKVKFNIYAFKIAFGSLSENILPDKDLWAFLLLWFLLSCWSLTAPQKQFCVLLFWNNDQKSLKKFCFCMQQNIIHIQKLSFDKFGKRHKFWGYFWKEKHGTTNNDERMTIIQKGNQIIKSKIKEY